jgi:hypothetical protein
MFDGPKCGQFMSVSARTRQEGSNVIYLMSAAIGCSAALPFGTCLRSVAPARRHSYHVN